MTPSGKTAPPAGPLAIPKHLVNGVLTMVASPVYTEIIDFWPGTTPTSLIAFTSSAAAKQRVAALIQREKSSGLTPEEKAELEHYLQLEPLMRLAKIWARHDL
ncbi:MAG: hypothetical protein R3E79_52560 [Caldilineaceae bacterium]